MNYNVIVENGVGNFSDAFRKWIGCGIGIYMHWGTCLAFYNASWLFNGQIRRGLGAGIKKLSNSTRGWDDLTIWWKNWSCANSFDPDCLSLRVIPTNLDSPNPNRHDACPAAWWVWFPVWRCFPLACLHKPSTPTNDHPLISRHRVSLRAFGGGIKCAKLPAWIILNGISPARSCPHYPPFSLRIRSFSCESVY